jgi:hypothetical protein
MKKNGFSLDKYVFRDYIPYHGSERADPDITLGEIIAL